MAAQTMDGDRKEGIFSLLDTDLYKLTMQCAVLKFWHDIPVSFKFTNRTPHMRLNRAAYNWLQQQVDNLANVRLTDEELSWLRKTCNYFPDDYLTFLRNFRFRPGEHVKLSFQPSNESADDMTSGDLSISISGLWVDTILYEIPLLALTSEAYFKFVDRDWNHKAQTQKSQYKGERLIANGCNFSEFGTRRRRDYRTHEAVMEGLAAAQKVAESNGEDWKGKFAGTSNVHFAMRFGLQPIGTVAHEWVMGIAAITEDYEGANEKAMRYWTATYGRGVLAIALTDTFGTPSFLRAFKRPSPRTGHTEALSEDWRNEPSFAKIFTGVRQDSGDPKTYVQLMRTFYDSEGITEPKTIVFSDSLNVDRCIEYKKVTEAAGLAPSFGIGTFFTNDFWRLSENRKSVPLNIVIKLSQADGHPCIKLSDDLGKNMGDDALMRSVKSQVGYQERAWQEGDEAHRWDKND